MSDFAKSLVAQYKELVVRADVVAAKRQDLAHEQNKLRAEAATIETLLLGIVDLLEELGGAEDLLGDQLRPPDSSDEEVSADELILQKIASSRVFKVVPVSMILDRRKLFGLQDYTDSGIRSAIARAIKRGDLERVGRGKVQITVQGTESYGRQKEKAVTDDDIPF